MWRRRRRSAPVGSVRADIAVPGTPVSGSLTAAGGLMSATGRRVWRMDRRAATRVPWSPPSGTAPSAVQAGVGTAQIASPTEGRLGRDMPSVYCTRCGQENPDGARFCSQCGAPLTYGSGEHGAETTSTISLGGGEPADGEFGDESLADAATLDALPAGTALLVVRRGPNAGSRFLLDSDLTLVGRHPDSDIFLDDVTVSRRHAEFYRQGGGFTVRDVGSLNGTYVNRERIEEAELSSGDEVQVGKFRLVFLLGPRSAAEHGGGAQVWG
jgi:FHA domain/zinc-ribbon domain